MPSRPATSSAAWTAAPAEMPARIPSRCASARAVSSASSSSTVITSSITERSSTSGTKPAPIPWILCGPGSPPESTGEAAGSTRDHLDVGAALLQHLADAGDRAAGPDARDEGVDLAVEVGPDLLGRRAAVDLGVGGVRELHRHVAVVLASTSFRASSTASSMPPIDGVSCTSAP